MQEPLGARRRSRPGRLPVLNRMVTVGLLATVGAVVTGCFAPGDPEGVAIGMRVDDGVLTVYVPLCPGESVTSAEVDLPQGNGKRVLTVEEPIASMLLPGVECRVPSGTQAKSSA